MREINIVTSCDENLALMLMPQMASVSLNMPGYIINFYLMHYRVSEESLAAVSAYAATLGNVNFKAITVDKEDVEVCETLTQLGGFVPETYFTLFPHKYLPNCDRALYIDAGDVIIVDDISEFYFHDFMGKALISASSLYLNSFADYDGKRDPRFGREDYKKGAINDTYKRIIFAGAINSGFFVMNNPLLRSFNLTARHFLRIAAMLVEALGGLRFDGDQPVVSAAFADNILNYPASGEGRFDMAFAPYNYFLQGTFELAQTGEVDARIVVTTARWARFSPRVYHYCAKARKPWAAALTEAEREAVAPFLPEPNFNQRGDLFPVGAYEDYKWFYDTYWKYCAMTPIYDGLYAKAREAGKAFVKRILEGAERCE